MSAYVDGFVLPIAKDRVEDYRELAEKAAALWKEHGALDYWECVADDLDARGMVPFPRIAGAGPDETVVFAWVVFRSREHRDETNEKIMADPRMQEICPEGTQTFDYTRMAYAGFRVLVGG